jgi:A/G-specific adenine glycosylase
MRVAGAAVRKKRTAAAVDADPAVLLAWYDRHRRHLPWRSAPGRQADPYHVWLSEIMLQQTTVKAVGPYYAKFLARWPDVGALAETPLDDVLKAWAGLGYYARARNLHACAKAVAREHGGRFPDTEDGLRALPGIGGYTAAAIAAIAFGRRAVAIDGNIERVIARLYAVEAELPAAKAEIRARADALVPDRRVGDFTQAMMDLGATICTPKKPACGICPWMAACAARARGDAETFPRKAPKVEGRMRYGASFVVTRADDVVLVRSRPEKGLLGGMTEMPSTPWVHELDDEEARKHVPLQAAWKKLAGAVEHGFTHFPLRQTVYVASVPAKTKAPAGMRWVALAELHGEALPNVMRKVAAHAGLLAKPKR